MQKHSIPVLFKYLSGAIGASLLEDDIMYIQDVGNKIAGRVYFDRGNKKMYKCNTTTTSTDNTPVNFTLVSLVGNTSTIGDIISGPVLLYRSDSPEQVGSILTLNDSISNYKYIHVVCGDIYENSSNTRDDFDVRTFMSSQILPRANQKTSITMSVKDSNAGSLSTLTSTETIYQVTSETTFTVLKMYSGGTSVSDNYSYIRSIYGIKY